MATLYKYETGGREVTYLDKEDVYQPEDIRKHWAADTFPELGNAGAATMGQAVRLFFESGFNNHLSGGKSQQYPQDVLGMWRELHRAQAEIYPADDLVPQRGTLGDLA